MNIDFNENAVIFQKILTLNCSVGNENVLVIFIGGIFTPHKYHFEYVALLAESEVATLIRRRKE